MDPSDWTFGTMLAVSLGAAVATVAANSLRTWMLERRAQHPPVLRHLTAYVLAYFAGLTAMGALPMPWSLLVVLAGISAAATVSIHGREPLLTREYAMMAATIFAALVALWALLELLRLAGSDMSAR